MYNRYYRRFRIPSKKTIFAILMVASAIMLFMPRDPLQPAKNITPLIALPQRAARQATQYVGSQIDKIAGKPVPLDQYNKAALEKQALENENAALRQSIAQLKSTQEQLTRIRSSPEFPQGASIIPVQILACDADPRRESLLVDKGSLKKVKDLDWVASRITINAGTNNGVHNRAQVMARECLIGWVEHAGLWQSRVVLLSDPQANRAMRIRIQPKPGGPDHNKRRGPADPLILEGAGNGKMKIRDIPANYVENGLIQTGDLVTSDRNDPKLPLSMVVGVITKLKRIQDDKVIPLFYEALVQHRYDPKKINQAYVVDMSNNTQKSGQ